MNTSTSKKETTVLHIGSRLEMFVDDHLVEQLKDVELRLHHPTPQEVAIQFDAPWEGPSSFYVTVLQDSDRYRAYYRGSGQGYKAPNYTIPHQFACYAESQDGITWNKPNLGICEFDGSTANNIVWDGYGTHNFMAFKDANPDAPDEQRYKAIPTGYPYGPLKRIIALSSPDGVHWTQIQEEPIITQPYVDWGADLAFWDAEQRQYVAYLRGWRTHRGGEPQAVDDRWTKTENWQRRLFRQVLRCTSPDFIHWTEPEFVDFGDTPLEHFYTNATTPYFRAPHIYLAFPKRLVPERKKVEQHLQPGVSDAVFMSSRDGVHFDRRFMEAFIRPGLDPQRWTERNNLPAWGVLPTADDEISLYYVEHFRYPTCRLRRASLRMDGFVSVNAGYAGGELLTKPLTFDGEKLIINYSTSAVGSIRVEVQDAAGHPVPGHTLQDCGEIYGDEIGHAVWWEGGSDLSSLADQPVRLRFALKDADLYSIQFR